MWSHGLVLGFQQTAGGDTTGLKSFTGLALERHFPPKVCVSSENPYCSHVGSIKDLYRLPFSQRHITARNKEHEPRSYKNSSFVM